MPKRPPDEKTSDTNVVIKKPNLSGHWSQGLVAAMNDPENVLESDDLTVIINDKYPKAKHHYMVLCKEEISGILKLDKTHIPLLKHMDKVARKFASKIDASFNIGYHSVPSMQRLHLHIISDDMDSTCLKTKVHWNSFTSKFFMASADLIQMVEVNGSVKKISDEKHKQLMATPLICHKCDHTPKTMPALKLHLKTHFVLS